MAPLSADQLIRSSRWRYGASASMICCLLAGHATTAHAEVYRWTDAEGQVHLSDRNRSSGAAEVVDLGPVNTFQGVSVEPLTAAPTNRGGEVVMYSTPSCGYCKQARRFFRDQGIAFTEHDIRSDAAARRAFERLGGKGVPLILIGDQRMSGFSEDRFLGLYER